MIKLVLLSLLLCDTVSAQIVIRGATLRGASIGLTNVAAPVNPFPSGADADWRLNADLTDSTGNGNTLTVNTSTASYTTNELNVANKAWIDSGTQYLIGNTTVGNYTSGDFSISIWFRYNAADFTAEAVLVSKGVFTTSGWYLQMHEQSGFPTSQGHVEFVINTGSSSLISKTSDSGMSVGVWYNVVITKTAAAVKIYINGVDSTTTSAPGSPASDSNTIKLGAYSSGSNKVNGNEAQVSVWPRALSSTEAASIYAGGSL